uniref:Uncharacterized protein n=1 Tax=Moniliophthora roreri TaxID=221103 RepID=A0A0W0F4K6_MONRR
MQFPNTLTLLAAAAAYLAMYVSASLVIPLPVDRAADPDDVGLIPPANEGRCLQMGLLPIKKQLERPPSDWSVFPSSGASPPSFNFSSQCDSRLFISSVIQGLLKDAEKTRRHSLLS